MSDETTETETQETGAEVEETTEPEWTPPDRDAWTKLQDKAQRREAKLREAQAELAKLRGERESAPEPSEADRLRQGLVRTASRAVLAGLDVRDRKDQDAILDVLRLDGVEVDDSGEVDTDLIEQRVSELRRILGAPAASVPAQRKVRRQDPGGSTSEPADPDRARRIRFLTGGR